MKIQMKITMEYVIEEEITESDAKLLVDRLKDEKERERLHKETFNDVRKRLFCCGEKIVSSKENLEINVAQ